MIENIQSGNSIKFPQDHAHSQSEPKQTESQQTQFESSASPNQETSKNVLQGHNIEPVRTEATSTCKKVVAVVIGLLSLGGPVVYYMQPTISSIAQPQSNLPFNWTAPPPHPLLLQFSPICTALDPREAPAQLVATTPPPSSQIEPFPLTDVPSTASRVDRVLQALGVNNKPQSKLRMKEWEMAYFTSENAKKMLDASRVSFVKPTILDAELKDTIDRLVASYLLSFTGRLTPKETEVSVSFEEDMCHVAIQQVHYNGKRRGGFSFKSDLNDPENILDDSSKFDYFFEIL